MRSFDEVLRIAREVQANPQDRTKASQLADAVLEVDQAFTNGQGKYPSHWTTSSTR